MSLKMIPYHKHRKAEEARKIEGGGLENAARVYADFGESFKGDSSSVAKFVRGGVIDPNAKLKTDTEEGRRVAKGKGKGKRKKGSPEHKDTGVRLHRELLSAISAKHLLHHIRFL